MSTEQSGAHERERFSSRLAFYFAAVGSAVGFGNIWRFPSLAYSYGGGAFFIPYILALFLIGIPILFLEIALGQYFQRGDVSVFAVFHKRMRGVGVSSIGCGFITLTYYSMLITWTARALFESGAAEAPWNSEEDLAVANATSYFFGEYAGMKTLREDDQRPTRLVGANVLYSFLVHLFIFICIAKGLQTTGKITYITMGLPVVLLFVFLILGCTLEGSGIGIKAYIGEWDMSVLTEKGDVWSTAVSQIFFSLSLTFGIMTAYGSHMPRDEPAFLNSCVIALANSTFSVIAGFAVFAVVGHQAFKLDTEVKNIDGTATFGLVFGLWPLALSKLPGGIHWVRLLFVFLLLLGIDSAFSFQEAMMTCIRDTERFRDAAKWKVALALSVTAWLLSLLYATDAGLYYLDTIDFYINFIMLIVGFFESFALGWIYDIENQIQKFGTKVVFCYMFGNFGSLLFACIFWFGLQNVWAGFVALVGFYCVCIGATIFMLNKKIASESGMESLGSAMNDLAFGNILLFKERVEPVIQYVPTLWCYLIKQFVPHVLLLLFVNLAQSKTDDGKSKFGNYEGYIAAPYQILGIFTFVLAWVLFLVGIVAPDAYSVLDTRIDEEEDNESKPKFPVTSPEAEA